MTDLDRWLLHNAEFRFDGDPECVMREETELAALNLPDGMSCLRDGTAVYRYPGAHGVKVGSFKITDGSKRVDRSRLTPGQPLVLEMLLDVDPGEWQVIYLLSFWRRGVKVARSMSETDRFTVAEPSVRPVKADLSPFLLERGTYELTISVYADTDGGTGGKRYDMLIRCATLEVLGTGNTEILFQHPAQWSFS